MAWHRTLFPSTILAAALVLTIAPAAAQDESANPDDEFERAFRDQNAEFEETRTAMENEWQAWVRADSVAFARFEAEITATWGDYRGTTKHEWVEYSADRASRSTVDFEAGTATVEVLVPVSSDTGEQAGRLRDAVADELGWCAVVPRHLERVRIGPV